MPCVCRNNFNFCRNFTNCFIKCLVFQHGADLAVVHGHHVLTHFYLEMNRAHNLIANYFWRKGPQNALWFKFTCLENFALVSNDRRAVLAARDLLDGTALPIIINWVRFRHRMVIIIRSPVPKLAFIWFAACKKLPIVPSNTGHVVFAARHVKHGLQKNPPRFTRR